MSSSPVNVPQIKYGCIVEKKTKASAWSWLDVPSSIFKCSEKVCLIFLFVLYESFLHIEIVLLTILLLLQVRSLLSSLQFSIMEIPVKDVSDSLSKGMESQFDFFLKLGHPH